ncbi:MAG TPA: ATP-binding cassette domain-containing protein [Gammaproteobacteria bacterium]|nr:ATP-binding cassette domain-containing protein [Gammaproteobacteria bacterium]
MALLEIEHLSVRFGDFQAVDQVSLKLDSGEVLGVVGESGSGKSVSMLAVMGLIPFPGVVSARQLNFDSQDMLQLSDKARRKMTGKEVAMIFQEPMTSLNPCFTVGFQIMEALKVHEPGDRKQRIERCIDLFEQVGIPSPKSRLSSFPHQMSGGMNQRVMIAMAIACNPRLLIADEPTTALDVTIQAQILDLLLELQQQTKMGLLLITHDMGVIAETAQRVIVMYAGQVVEEQGVNQLFTLPSHPYTRALLDALPERSRGCRRLPTIAGVVPGPFDRPRGCLFSPRCQFAQDLCYQKIPPLLTTGQARVRCHFPLQGATK